MATAELTATMVWPGALPPALVRFIGGAEFLGARLHVLRGECGALPINLTLGLLAAFVAWGRFKKAPIPAR